MRLELIPLDLIEEPSIDVRTWVSREKLDELIDLIRGHGFRDPITVKENNGRYEIVDGHRRWMAAKEAGLIRIPCIIVDDPDSECEVTKLILNLGREDLSPLEISRHLWTLKNLYGYSNEDLARFMNVGEGRIRQLLGLEKLPEELKQALEDKRIGERVARALAQIEDESRRKYLLQYALDGGATVKTVENWVRAEKAGLIAPPTYNGEPPKISDEDLEDITKIQCACCHHRFSANAMITMTLDPECYAIAQKLFREIRKNVYEPQEKGELQTGLGPEASPELQPRDHREGLQGRAHDTNKIELDDEEPNILRFLEVTGRIHTDK